MKNILFITMLLGALYSQCNESNWQEYYNSEGHNMVGCDLVGAYLEGADLSGADLSGADLFQANLSDANLSYANLYGAFLFQANLFVANLEGANLVLADLSYTDLGGVNFYGANLFMATLDGANLGNVELIGVNLEGADLSGANLVLADLTGANLTGAILAGAFLWRANLSNANLSGAVCMGAFFVDATLEGTIFDGASLGNAYFDENEDGYDDASYEVGYIAGHSDGVIVGMESVDITMDNQAVCEDCYADGEASVDTNSDGLVDEFPLITILGDPVLLLTQSFDSENYTDAGASCFAGDTEFSHAVEVSGQVVNMSNIGTYIITYNCSDTEGNQAMSKSRTVIVQADYTDTDEDGYDDASYDVGAESGDLNLDGIDNVLDVVILVDNILNP